MPLIRLWASALLVVCLVNLPASANAASSWPRKHGVALGPRRSQPAALPLPAPPAGVHEEQRPLYGAIITGAVFTGVGALFLAGGLITAESIPSSPPHGATEEDDRAYRASALPVASFCTAVGIAHLAVGVPLLTIGLLAHRTVYVPNKAASFTLVPVVSSDRVGGVFTLHF